MASLRRRVILQQLPLYQAWHFYTFLKLLQIRTYTGLQISFALSLFARNERFNHYLEHVKRVELLEQVLLLMSTLSFHGPMFSARDVSVNTIRVKWICTKMKRMKGWNTSAFLWSALVCLWTINVTPAVHTWQADFTTEASLAWNHCFMFPASIDGLSRLDCNTLTPNTFVHFTFGVALGLWADDLDVTSERPCF